MIICDQIQEVLNDKKGRIVTSKEIRKWLKNKYGTNPDSVLLSDFCYNRTNDGIRFNKETRLFEYIGKNQYLYLGVNSSYTGTIFHKPKGSKAEIVAGEWYNGEIRL